MGSNRSLSDGADVRSRRWPSPRSCWRCCRPCSTRPSSPRRCRRSRPTSGRLSDVSWVVTAYVVAAAATTPLWGTLGDRRRPQADARAVAGAVPGGLGRLRAGDGIAMLIAVPRRAGRRRRRADEPGHGRGGRPRVAARARPLPGLHRLRVRGRHHRRAAGRRRCWSTTPRWRWVFYVNLPLGLAALAGLRLRLPAPEPAPARGRSTWPAPRCWPAPTSAFMLACIWGGDRYAWALAEIAGLLAAGALLGVALGWRERRVADPVVPLGLLRTRTVAVASAPRCSWPPARCSRSTCSCRCSCRRPPARSPTEAGLLLVPAMARHHRLHELAGREGDRVAPAATSATR